MQTNGMPLRKFIQNGLSENHNKYWTVQVTDQGNGTALYHVEYARVGAKPQIKEETGSLRAMLALAEKKIAEKTSPAHKDGPYHEVELAEAAPTVVVSQDPLGGLRGNVRGIVEYIYHEAGQAIASYLAVRVDALSEKQIRQGWLALDAVRGLWRGQITDQLIAAVQTYYNTIPTQLPSRIDPVQVTRAFVGNFNETETRLQQLEAAVATIHQSAPTLGGTLDPFKQLGAQVSEVDAATYQRINAYVVNSVNRMHGFTPKVSGVFALTVYGERQRFEACPIGNSAELFHGTDAGNVRHILKGGLIVPRSAANGRMFGDGIYFANQSTKSGQYCSARGRQLLMFVAEVKLGKQYVVQCATRNLPAGYHSMYGKAGRDLRNDEFIVYRQDQQTLRYLVSFEKGR